MTTLIFWPPWVNAGNDSWAKESKIIGRYYDGPVAITMTGGGLVKFVTHNPFEDLATEGYIYQNPILEYRQTSNISPTLICNKLLITKM